MSELFVAYKGVWLEISAGFDQRLREWFPEIDLQQQYRMMDAYLDANYNRRPRSNMAKFVVNWLKKHELHRPKVAAELKVGQAPRPSAQTHVKAEVLARYLRNAKRL